MLFKDSYLKVLFHTMISMIREWEGPKKHDLKNGAAFKEQSLYLSLLVIVQLLQGIIAVTKGGDRVRFESLT